MIRRKAEWRKYLLGSTIVLSLVLGGGTVPGLWTEALLQVMILTAAALMLVSANGERIDRRILWLSGLTMAAILFQLLPLPAGLIEPLRPTLLSSGRFEEGGTNWSFISLGLGRTMESFVYVAVLVALALALLRLPGEQLHHLLPFLLAGMACNAVAAAVQYSATETVRLEGYLPFTISAGMFANRNHLAALLYASLPLLLYIGRFRGMGLWSTVSILFVLLVLLAAGSRAGAVLGIAALVLSALFFASRTRAGIVSFLTFATVLGVYSVATWTLLDSRDLEPDFGRMEFARTTVAGIADNWALGVGFGNFQRAYQAYENPAMIFRSYVNHAHNDYIELVFEGGIVAAILILSYFAITLIQLIKVRHSHFHKATFLSFFFILLHSTVDYPLRTMGIAVAFVYFNAILFHTGLRPTEKTRKTRIKVRHNGHNLTVPVEPA